MATSSIHQCTCPICRSERQHPDRAYHHHINVLLSRLTEPQRRWFAAVEALHIGHGGKQLLARITGMSPTTILRGCVEIKADLTQAPDVHLRASGGGRPAAEDQDPGLEAALLELLESETAGDPMGRRAKAKRSSLRHLSQALTARGHPTSRMTVAKLLHKLEFSPKANARRAEAREHLPKNATNSLSILVSNAPSSKPQATLSSASIRKKRNDRQLQECWANLVQRS